MAPHSRELRLLLVGAKVVLVIKNLPSNAGDIGGVGSILGQEDPLEKGMATHSSILAWRILMDREAYGLQPMRSQRVRHD